MTMTVSGLEPKPGRFDSNFVVVIKLRRLRPNLPRSSPPEGRVTKFLQACQVSTVCGVIPMGDEISAVTRAQTGGLEHLISRRLFFLKVDTEIAGVLFKEMKSSAVE